MHINQKKNIIQTMHESNNNDNHISWKDQTLSCLVNDSQIIMNLEEQCSEEGERLYESAHVDSLMETSFVQLDKLEAKLGLTQQNNNFESGESFFRKSNNNLCRTDLGNKKLKRMKNKKLQCDIGCGGRQQLPSTQSTLLSKMRRLQILKIIKLLRLLFKSVRASHTQIKQQVKQQLNKNQQFFQGISNQVSNMQKYFIDVLGCKDLRILQLEQDLDQVMKMNNKLLDRIEKNKRESQRIIIEMVEEKQKSLAEINNMSVTASIKAEQIEEENEKLKKQIDFFQIKADSFEEKANDNQILIKKLQYQNQKLTNQNQQYFARQDQLIRQLQSLSDSNCELALQLQNISEDMLKLNRVNQLYQIELQSTKKELKRSEQTNYKLLRQCQTKVQHNPSRQPQKITKIKSGSKLSDPNTKNILSDRQNKLQQHQFVFKSIQQKDAARNLKLSEYLRLKAQTKIFCSSDGIMKADLKNLIASCNSNPDKETYLKNMD